MIEIFTGIFLLLAIFFAVRAYKLAQKVLDLQELLIDEYAKSLQGDDTIQEQFLKFVSDSREWAFDYIENVQNTLNEIAAEIEPVVSMYTLEDLVLDNSKSLLHKTYNEIVKILPDEDK